VEQDLRDALESGQVGGAAFDVFVTEPAKENILFGHPNFIATPHLGASTREAQENVALQVAEQMADYLIDGAITNALNMPSMSAEDARRLGPYVALAEQLGSFAGQLTNEAITEIEIGYEGEVSSMNVRALTQAALTGVLAPQSAAINMVNAPVIARDRGIRVSEVRRADAGSYHTAMRVSVTTAKQSREVAGTLFRDNKPRLIQVKGIELEAELGPHMLYVTNQDKPGFIGALGSTLGAAGINIATFHLGRARSGGDAICLIAVDQPIGDDVLARILELPGVVQARLLHFRH